MRSINQMKFFLEKILKGGLSGRFEEEHIHKTVIFNLFCFIGTFYLVYFGLKSFLAHSFIHAFVVMSFLFLILILQLYFWLSKKYLVAGFAIVLMMFLFELYLIVSGGSDKTTFLWMYVFPLLSLFTLGLRMGSVFIALLLTITMILFYIQPNFMVEYSDALEKKLIATFIGTTLLAIATEYVRKRTYDSLTETNIEKDNLLKEVQFQKEEISEKNNEIITQNDELLKHRWNLERLVNERTSELVIAKNHAEESDRLKSSFLANMSHEIRTPMNAIVGFSQLITDSSIDADTRKEYSEHIQNNTNSLLKLIEDIIDISSIESGTISICESEFDLNKLLKKINLAFNESKKEISKQSIAIELSSNVNEEVFYIKSDENRLKQIISNLIENALKFTDHGNIEFGYEKSDNFIQFYIKDTGIGISAEHQEYIFDRFSKGEIDKKKLYRGTGLGLAICKNLVTLLKGEIWVKSEINNGSTFFFRIPYQDLSTKLNHWEASVNQYNEFDLLWKGKTILIAEDEESNFKYLVALLKGTEVKIIRAKDGVQALEEFKNNKIDIILMDIKMPLMDGIEATKLIRKINNEVPIIAQTAYVLDNDEKLTIAAGCSNYISKPIYRNSLLSLINKYLKKL